MHANTRARSVWPILFLVSLLVFSSAFRSEGAEDVLKLTVLHLNDPHGHYVPYQKRGVEGRIGGFAKASSVIEAARTRSASEGRRTLLFMAGDLLMGTPYSTAFKGSLGVSLMNHMKFDAMTVGNHEFDYGKTNLISRLKPLMGFPLLSENITTREGNHIFDRVVVRKFEGSDTRVVIFGLTTSDTPVTTFPDNVQGLVFDDPIETARELLKDFSHEDFIIAVTHLGIEEDRKLARACPKIDVIIGGHSHTKIFTPEKVGDTLICQAGAYSEFLGKLDVDVVNGRIVSHDGRLILLGPAAREDPQVVSLIENGEAMMDAKLNEVIGTTEVFLDGSLRGVRGGTDTNLGRLITSIMARSCGTDLAIINGGAIRNSLQEGPITIGDVYSVLPFQGTLVKVNLSGEDLRTVIGRSHDLPEGSGGKLQVFGVTLRAEHREVVIDEVAGKDFDPARIYSAAINDFLLAGGDGYEIFREKGTEVEKTGRLIAELLIDYIKRNKVITGNPAEKP